MRIIGHAIGGSVTIEGAGRLGDVFAPAHGTVQAQVRLASAADVDLAVSAAADAQPGWAAMNPQRRARVLFRLKELIERETEPLARLLASEHGKILEDAKGDIQRGLDVIEFCCGVPHLLKGEYSRGAGSGLDVWSQREPLGVVAGITPFNFPAMIPMWMFGPAIATGNAFVLKPSERTPSVPLRLAELFAEAGLPDGVFNVVNGDREAVEALIDHPAVMAVSFVGSSDIAHRVYMRAAAGGKRVQAMGGAKNHGIVMPDADLDQAVSDIIGAAYGSAGERCMAMPVVVPVGEATAKELRARLIDAIARLRVGTPLDVEADYGPMVGAPARDRVKAYVEMGLAEGAELVVDGRDFTLQGHENGFFIGPSLFDHVTSGMQSYRDEIFGPVLQIVRAQSLDAAVDLASRHPYGNGAAIFTRDGAAARRFVDRVEAGMVGVNVPIPVPISYHSFGGWKRSAFGDHNQYGMEGIRFYTRNKVVTQRWPDGADSSATASFVIPADR